LAGAADVIPQFYEPLDKSQRSSVWGLRLSVGGTALEVVPSRSGWHPDPALGDQRGARVRRPNDGQKAHSLLQKGEELASAGDAAGAIALFDQIVSRWQSAEDTDALSHVTAALLAKARVLKEAGQIEEAFSALDRLIARSAGASHPLWQATVVEAFVEKGVLHGTYGQVQESLDAFDEGIRRFGSSDEPKVRTEVAFALFNKGISLRNVGRDAEALAAFDEVLRRFGEDEEIGIRRAVAITLFNKAVVLSNTVAEGDADAARAALAAYEEVIHRFGSESDPAIRTRVARSLSYQASRLQEFGDEQAALDVRQDLVQRFGDAEEPEILRLVAQGLFEIGQMLLARGDSRRARESFEEIVSRFGADPDVEIRQVVAAAQGHQRVLRSMGPRARHIESRARGAEQSRSLEERSIQVAEASHRAAEDVLDRYRSIGQPFALYLRNFDLEYWEATSGQGVTIESIPIDVTRTAEPDLAKALEGRVQLIGVANPSLPYILHPELTHLIPKLELSNETWDRLASELIPSASLIVVDLWRVTPGLSTELQIVLDLGHQDLTVVILEEPDALEEGLKDFYGIREAAPGSGSSGSAALAHFPRVVRRQEVPFDRLGGSPLFADILGAIDFVKGLTPEQRRIRDEVRHHLSDGVEFTGSGRYTEAHVALGEALVLAREIGDRMGETAALNSLGVVDRLTGDIAGAKDRYEQAVASARDIRYEQAAGLALSHLAEAYEASAEFDTALRHYEEALDFQSRVGTPVERLATLEGIGGLHRRRRESARAVEAYELALSICRDIDDVPAAARVLRSIGLTHYVIADYVAAIPPLLESAEVSRTIDPESEVAALALLGRAYLETGKRRKAKAHFRNAMALADRLGESEVAFVRRMIDRG
jgi:tetratricopeptide (TPR) repeat protein